MTTADDKAQDDRSRMQTAWEEFDIQASYDNKITVKILGIEPTNPFRYIVKRNKQIFLAERSKIKLLKK